ncbi:MAG: hypothetical protein ABEI57_04390 [Halapricum sp.]
MGTVTTHLASQARSIFDDLGYTVSDDGEEIRAERKWRVVQVTPMSEPKDAPTTGKYRCFVTRSGNCNDLRSRLDRQNVGYEWAIISVDEDGDYEVCDATTIP